MSKSPATSQIKAKSSQDKPNESDEVFQQDLKGGNVKLESKYERMKPGEYMIHVLSFSSVKSNRKFLGFHRRDKRTGASYRP